MSRLTTFILGLVVASVCAFATAQELLPLKHIVIFNNNGRKPPTPNVYPLFRLSEPFCLVEDFYTPGTLDPTITANLGRSKMLYIGQYCNEGPLFSDAELCEAMRSLLKRQGLIFFDYHTGAHGIRFRPETVKFLKNVGVTPPDEFHPGYGKSVFEAPNVHAILSRPTPIGGKDAGHYGWWERWPTEQIVLAHDRDDNGKATLLIQEKVLGNGAIMFNQLPSAFRESTGIYFDLVRNILSYASAAGMGAQ